MNPERHETFGVFVSQNLENYKGIPKYLRKRVGETSQKPIKMELKKVEISFKIGKVTITISIKK